MQEKLASVTASTFNGGCFVRKNMAFKIMYMLFQEVEPLPELFWDPTPEIRKQRLPRHLVDYSSQGEFESEKYVQTLNIRHLEKE